MNELKKEQIRELNLENRRDYKKALDEYLDTGKGFEQLKAVDNNTADQILALFEPEGLLTDEVLKILNKNRCQDGCDCDFPQMSRDINILTQQFIAQARQALEDDASDLWKITNAIKDEVKSRSWIMDGRGSYEWNDDRYRDETKIAFEAILKIISDVQEPAQRRFHQTVTITDTLAQAHQQGYQEAIEWVKGDIDERINALSSMTGITVDIVSGVRFVLIDVLLALKAEMERA